MLPAFDWGLGGSDMVCTLWTRDTLTSATSILARSLDRKRSLRATKAFNWGIAACLIASALLLNYEAQAEPEKQEARAGEQKSNLDNSKNPGMAKVCITDDEPLTKNKVKEIMLPIFSILVDNGKFKGDFNNYLTWRSEHLIGAKSALLMMEPATLTLKQKCANVKVKLLFSKLYDGRTATIADPRLYQLEDFLEYPIPPKKPSIEMGALIDNGSISAILISDVNEHQDHLDGLLDEAKSAEVCLSEARKLAFHIKGSLGRQTRSIVEIKNTPADSMSQGCPFGPKNATDVYISWSKQARPPAASMALIARAGEFSTGATEAEFRQETDACVTEALKPQSLEMSSREFRGVKIECQAFRRDGAGGSITIYRRFGKSPVRPDLTADQLLESRAASEIGRIQDQAEAAKTLEFVRWWQDPAIPQTVKTFAMMTARVLALSDRCKIWKPNPAMLAQWATSAGVKSSDIEPGGKYFPLLVEMMAAMKANVANETPQQACEAARKYG